MDGLSSDALLCTPLLSSLDNIPSRESFPDFMTYIGRDDEGHRLVIDPLTVFMGSLYEECYRAGIHVSEVGFPGVGKSTRARMFALFCLGRHPPLKIGIVSAEKAIARRGVTFCRSIIGDAEEGELSRYRSVFPEIVPDDVNNRATARKGWKQGEFFILIPGVQSVDATMEAIAARPKGESRRLGFVLFDDMTTQEVAESRGQRTEMLSRFMSTFIEGRLVNPYGRDGFGLHIQNCWHKEDTAHRLIEDHRFCSVWVGVRESCDSLFIKLLNAPPAFDPGAIKGIEGLPRSGWEERAFSCPLPPSLTTSDLIEEKTNPKTSRRFTRTKRLIALSDEDRMFPSWPRRETFEGTVSQMLGVPEAGRLPQFAPLDNMRFPVVGGIDFASGKRKGDSITFIGRSPKGVKYPIAHFRGAFSIAQIIDLISLVWDNGIHFHLLYAENNAQQARLVDAIKGDSRRRNVKWWPKVQGFLTGKNKASEEIGLPALDGEIANGGFVWPAGEQLRTDAVHASAWATWAAEMSDTPRIFQPSEATADSVMSMWFAWRAFGAITFGRPGLHSGGVTADSFRRGKAEGIL